MAATLGAQALLGNKLENAVVQTILWLVGIAGTQISLGVFTLIYARNDLATGCPTPTSISSISFFLFLALTIVEFFYAYISLCTVQSFSFVQAAFFARKNNASGRTSFLIWHVICLTIVAIPAALSAYSYGLVHKVHCPDVSLLSQISFLVFFAMSVMELLALYGALMPHRVQNYTNLNEKPISTISV
ncbi:hypothetical protein AAVH_06061 [Aphelenchoides avenae]|nr:hypothetical protein AAVH_06061 [Aphelenchus avenae]